MKEADKQEPTVAKEKQKELDYVRIEASDLQEFEQGLSILNPQFLKFVFEKLNKIITPVYKEDK